MIAASLFDSPWFLVLLVLVTLVRWLVSKAKSRVEEGQSPMEPPPTQPITRGGQTQSEEERIRKFLEALGQPAGSSPPPPKVIPRMRTVLPKIFPSLPPLKTVPPPLPVEEATPFVAPPPLPPQASAFRPLEADFQVQDFARQTSSEPPADKRRSGARSFARIKFGSPQDLRTAIVLREIFGPPRSLQPFDLTSSS